MSDLIMIGKSMQKRFFGQNYSKEMNYYSQAKAWSDRKTFAKWFKKHTHIHIRACTTRKFLLIPDNCGPHCITLKTTNCTSLYHRMVCGVITMESFQVQMGFSFPFLRANNLRSSLLIMRTRRFLLSCK